MADDSGLEVDALGGRPGVLSARYAGEPVDYGANNRKLLRELKNAADRGAQFVSVIALCDPEGTCRTVSGRVRGRIISEARGSSGFGYDPVFIPDGYTQTFAEMAPAEKNAISHRAMALKRAAREWAFLSGDGAADFAGLLEEDFVKIATVESGIQARILEAALREKNVPHVVRSYEDSAYDGLFQRVKGWGCIEAPERFRAEILECLEDLKTAGCAEPEPGDVS